MLGRWLALAVVASVSAVLLAVPLAVAEPRADATGTDGAGGAPNTELARAFAPKLYFDRTERWRPLDIDRLLKSGQVVLCVRKSSCAPVSSAADLQARGYGYLDVEGDLKDPASYRSADQSCLSQTLLDCDGGDAGGMYFHVRSRGAYRYIDYWFYYRFNDAARQSFDHESDWEGVVVAVPKHTQKPETFDFVEFAAHNGVYRYLREALRCERRTDPCGVAAKRVAVFVARGTHASYPRPCKGIKGFCRQNTLPWLEGRFDGGAPWGGNDDLTMVKPFPADGWTTWGGAWDPGRHVRSPGQQARFRNPWDSTCVTRWHIRRAGTCLTPSGKRDPCASWFGPFTTAVVCNGARIAKSLVSGGLRKSRRIVIRALLARSGSVDGLTQAVGVPVLPGLPVEIEGREVPADELFVRAENDDYIALARFDSLALDETGAAEIRATGWQGKPTLEIVPQGQFATPPRPVKPAAVVFIKR